MGYGDGLVLVIDSYLVGGEKVGGDSFSLSSAGFYVAGVWGGFSGLSSSFSLPKITT